MCGIQKVETKTAMLLFRTKTYSMTLYKGFIIMITKFNVITLTVSQHYILLTLIQITRTCIELIHISIKDHGTTGV